jgi:hypothetical protein
MAKKNNLNEDEVQLELPKSDFDVLRSKRYSLVFGSILMPELIEGRMEWINVPQNRFDQKAQDKLFDFWKRMKEEEPKFDIEAKVNKLLIEVK